MKIKKGFNSVYGVDLTAKEKKALELEVKRQLAEYDTKHSHEMDAIVLWVLHTQFGFGHKRLKEFFDCFSVAVSELIERYELENSDAVWLCTHQLKEYGIDIAQWNRERNE
jgi:hypothetical protein